MDNITKAREAWIKRYAGYFGPPLLINEYRRGDISFSNLVQSAKRHAEDMVSEACRVHEGLRDD